MQAVYNKIGLVDHYIFKIADCGLATVNDNELLEKGTRSYMAPELFEETKPTVANANVVDIWASGVTLFSVATGTLPFIYARDEQVEH